MQGIEIIIGMVICAAVAFVVLMHMVRAGQSGWSITVLSVLGGVFVVLIYAAVRPFGIHPVVAMTTASLVVVPALLGGGAGALLGWLMRKRDDRLI